MLRLTPGETETEAGRSRERYHRAALTTAASLATRIVTILAGLVSVPLALHYLGTERYGLWVTISSLLSILTFADLGVGNGLLNAISEAHGKQDEQLARRYVSSAFFLLSGIAGGLALVVVLGYPLVPWPRVFNVSSTQAVAEIGPAVLVFLGCFLLNLPLGIATRIQLGYQEGYLNSPWEAAGSVLGLVGLLAVTSAQAGLPWLVLALAGGPVLGTVANTLVLGLRRRALWPRLQAVSIDASSRILRSGLLQLAGFCISGQAFGEISMRV